MMFFIKLENPVRLVPLEIGLGSLRDGSKESSCVKMDFLAA